MRSDVILRRLVISCRYDLCHIVYMYSVLNADLMPIYVHMLSSFPIACVSIE